MKPLLSCCCCRCSCSMLLPWPMPVPLQVLLSDLADRDWCEQQVLASANWGGHIANFFTGGLNLQVGQQCAHQGVRWEARVPYPCSLHVPSSQDAGPIGDQNPKAYVHKGGVLILSYLIYQATVDGVTAAFRNPVWRQCVLHKSLNPATRSICQATPARTFGLCCCV
jgi:hypothetical protein